MEQISEEERRTLTHEYIDTILDEHPSIHWSRINHQRVYDNLGEIIGFEADGYSFSFVVKKKYFRSTKKVKI